MKYVNRTAQGSETRDTPEEPMRRRLSICGKRGVETVHPDNKLRFLIIAQHAKLSIEPFFINSNVFVEKLIFSLISTVTKISNN